MKNDDKTEEKKRKKNACEVLWSWILNAYAEETLNIFFLRLVVLVRSIFIAYPRLNGVN